MVKQKTENIPDDEWLVWHTNEYRVPEEKIEGLMRKLSKNVKLKCHAHAFDEKRLMVALTGKIFEVSPTRDASWDAMIE